MPSGSLGGPNEILHTEGSSTVLRLKCLVKGGGGVGEADELLLKFKYSC